MRTYAVFIVLVCCLVILSFFYDRSVEHTNPEPSVIYNSMASLKKILPESGQVYCLKRQRCFGMVVATYSLAPRLTIEVPALRDSTFLLFPAAQIDSFRFYKQLAAQVIWEASDEHYHYLLINPR